MLWIIQRQLGSRNIASRRKAAEQLCANPDPRALGALRGALSDEDPTVRTLAATALGKLDDERRIEPLIGALDDPNPEVQKAAIIALKHVSGERTGAALALLLRHEDASVRGSAAQVLEHSGWHPSNRQDEVWLLTAKGQFSRAAAFGVMAIPALETVIDFGPYSLSVGAAQALGDIADPRVMAPLLRALKSGDAAVCVAAVDALCKLDTPEVVPPITSMLCHVNAQVRLSATEALGNLGISEAVEPILELLQDPVWDVRRAAAEALGRLRDPRVLKALAEKLCDKDADVREATASALGNLGDRRAIGPLVMTLADSMSGVRRITAAALSRIDQNWGSSSEARQAAEQLEATLKDKDSDVRYFVGQLLGALGRTEIKPPPPVEPERLPPELQQKRRKLAVSLFLAILSDPDRDFRQAAAESLGRLGEDRAESALMRTVGDADLGVRMAAERALKLIRTQTA